MEYFIASGFKYNIGLSSTFEKDAAVWEKKSGSDSFPREKTQKHNVEQEERHIEKCHQNGLDNPMWRA